MKEWIVGQWIMKDQFDKMEIAQITITLMNSPFYKGERYAVRLGGMCLSVDGKWEFEPQPSSRDDEFYELFRFRTLEAAKEAAEKVSNLD